MFNFDSIDTIFFTYSDAERRKYRRATLICLGLLFAAFGLGIILNISDALNQVIYVLLLVVLLFGALYFYWYQRMLKNRIAVSPVGIAQIHPDLHCTILLWDEVAKLQQHKSLERIDLRDSTGKHRIRVEYQIGNFEILKSYIYARLRRLGHTLPPN